MSKILVIEDNDTIRENISEILTAEDYGVMTAANGLAGVVEAIKYQPDVIISDISMPELDGHEVLNALRDNSITKHVPLIFLSASNDASDYLLGKSLGAYSYLTKPFSRQDLLKVIEGALQVQMSR